MLDSGWGHAWERLKEDNSVKSMVQDSVHARDREKELKLERK